MIFFLYRSFEKHADREEKPMKILTTLLETATENSMAAKDAALFQTIVEKAQWLKNLDAMINVNRDYT